MVVAVVGSRRGADLDDVRAFMHALWAKYPSTIVLSGGADGVDSTAEQTWMQLGGNVWSLRPRQNVTGYCVEVWKLGAKTGTKGSVDGACGPYGVQVLPDPSFENFTSAAVYRDALIAEKADRLVSFQRAGGSAGTSITVGFAEKRGIPVHRYDPERPFSRK